MDYYSILGVAPGASGADIKRAYRRLARRHHPGINPGDPAAQALFERISTAYETLVDPERRRRYDAADAHFDDPEAHSLEFSGFDFTVAALGSQAATFTELFADVLHPLPREDRSRPEAGADVRTPLSLSFADALRGVARQVVVTRQVPCAECQGSGEVATAGGKCAQCRGDGEVRWARGHMVFTRTCVTCDGTGSERRRHCRACAGQGRVSISEGITVRIPPGIRDGARLRIPELGHSGRAGGRGGDLYIDVEVRPHPVLRRDGDDLHMIVPVAIHEAALGARIELPAVDGAVQLRIPPGTKAGQRLRLSGRGAPSAAGGRGDLYFEVRLAMPDVLDERSKELMREFGRLNSEDVRRGLHEALKTEH